MTRHNAATRKVEPPDRGKSSQKQSIGSFANSPIRPTKASLSKVSSPKPLTKDRLEKYSFKIVGKPSKSPAKGKPTNRAITKLLNAVRDPTDIPTADPIDPLDSPLYTVRNANKLKSSLMSIESSKKLNSDENNMDWDEIYNFNQLPQGSADTKLPTRLDKLDEVREGAKSIQSLDVNISEEETADEVFSTNIQGKRPISLSTQDLNNPKMQRKMSQSITKGKASPAMVENQNKTFSGEAKRIMPENRDKTYFKAIDKHPHTTFATSNIDETISNQIGENIAKIRAAVSNTQDGPVK